MTRVRKLFIVVYICHLAAYLGASGLRLRTHSNDNHFAYLADMWLHGRLDLGHTPPNSNDWAEVEYLELNDGRTVAGTFLRAQPQVFHQLGGKRITISPDQIKSRSKKYYVSFPPFPALLFLPLVAIWGLNVNDVLFNCLLAPLGPALLFLILRRQSALGRTSRSESEDLWLTGMFGLGTIYYYSSVIGQVWYTAHIVSTVFAAAFMLASIEARHPILAGLALGAVALTRPQMGFFGIYFLWELSRLDRKLWLKKFVQVAIPVAVAAAIGAWFNYARFHSFTEFGHWYLNVRWTPRIQRYGLFNYAYLSRNLAAAFLLMPKLLPRPPYFSLPWHGLSMLITTPSLVLLLWPRNRPPIHTALWLTAAPIALLSFLYQNDGWVQFGFRFSIDYLLLLVMLLAVGGRPMTRNWKILILVGVAVNFFGAVTYVNSLYGDFFFSIDIPAEL
jgi:hypothetical protein